EPDIREALCVTVSQAGATVRGVATAGEALEVLAAATPDVLVCDIGLPGEDGYSLMARLRESSDPAIRTLPAVALTAYARSDDRRAALQAGFQAHLAKPVAPDTLLRALSLHVAVSRRNVPMLPLVTAKGAEARAPAREPRSDGAADDGV